MAGKPYQSCLVPYENEIISLRRKKPPVPYSQIAALLSEKYQINVRRGTIFSFMEIRSKDSYKNKTCKHAWNMELKDTNNQTTVEVPLMQKQTIAQTSKSAVAAKPKPPFNPLSDEFEMEFSETYNLTRLTPEEAEARIKQLEEMEKQRVSTKPTITDKPKATVDYNPSEKTFKMPFSETYNLHRVSAEEAAARLKKLEEKEKRR